MFRIGDTTRKDLDNFETDCHYIDITSQKLPELYLFCLHRQRSMHWQLYL
jgi:hypothetical protein